MTSLVDALKNLETDLAARPLRIAAHSDMPFAIFRYDPADEFLLRKQLRLMAITLRQEHARNVTFVSMGRLVWQAINACGGTADVVKTEALRGFDAAQHHVNRLLDRPEFRPAATAVLDRLSTLNPANDVAFLVRAGAFAPFVYRASVLLDTLHYQTMVPTVFFYPGSAKAGTDLHFYDLPNQSNLGVYNYRVKVYGVQS